MGEKLKFKEVVLFFVLGIVVYFNSLWINFIWDDTALVLFNPLIKSPENALSIFSSHLSIFSNKFYRPLQNLTYMFDYAFFKFDYRGYHLTSILLHIGAAILSFKLLLMFTHNRRVSIAASLLFLVCPLWVESVSYISGRADILMSVFLLAAFICFIKNKIVLNLAFFALALLCKEASLIYPLVLLLYIVLFKIRERGPVAGVVFSFLLSAGYVLLRMLIDKPVTLAPSDNYILGVGLCFQGISRYLLMLFFPINQHMGYLEVIPVSLNFLLLLVSLVILGVFIFIFAYYAKKEKMVAFFIGWFFISLLPYSGLVPINAYFSEHFIYLASLGIFVVSVYFLDKFVSSKVFYFIIFAYLAFYSVAVVKYNFVWQDPVRFYSRIIRLSPGNFDAYNNLGVVYLNLRDFNRAEELIEKTLELKPHSADAKLNLARLYYFKQDYAKAIELGNEAVKLDPANFMAHLYLGAFYYHDKKLELAEEAYKKVLVLNPGFEPARDELFYFYLETGKPKQAEALRYKRN